MTMDSNPISLLNPGELPSRGDYGTMQWLVDDRLVPGAGLSVARMTVESGCISPSHRHPNCNEVIYLMTGEIEQRVGDTWLRMKAGDSAFVPACTVHATRNTGAETAILIVSYSAGDRIYEPVDQ
jgi:quercetin dioxygenase-like cupin family protein